MPTEIIERKINPSPASQPARSTHNRIDDLAVDTEQLGDPGARIHLLFGNAAAPLIGNMIAGGALLLAFWSTFSHGGLALWYGEIGRAHV